MTTPTLAKLDCRSCLNSGGEHVRGVGGRPFSTCRAEPPTIDRANHRMEDDAGAPIGWVGEYPFIAEDKPCGRHTDFIRVLLGPLPQPVAASIELDAGHSEKGT